MIPSWAKYQATDSDGEVCVYEYEPMPRGFFDGGFWLSCSGEYGLLIEGESNPDWQSTLQQRPSAK